MITYELFKELADTGFPFKRKDGSWIHNAPRLNELIEECGAKLHFLFNGWKDAKYTEGVWYAGYIEDVTDNTKTLVVEGNSIDNAVTRLWLELRKKGVV